jgi:hypothetical protein
MCFLAIAFLAHGGQHWAEYSRRALKVHTRFLAPLKRIDCALIAVLRCSSLSTGVMSASSTCFSRIRHHAALLSAADRCQLPRQLPRAQSFAIDYHLFSPVSRAFLCSPSLAGTGGRVGVAWYLRLLWRRRQRLCGGVPCAPLGELLLFRRSYLCRSLCAASGDLCLFLLSRGCRLLCAVCGSFGSRRCVVCVSVAVPLCRRRQLLAGALCRSCSAVLAPRVVALYWHHRLALGVCRA